MHTVDNKMALSLKDRGFVPICLKKIHDRVSHLTMLNSECFTKTTVQLEIL